MLLECHLPTPVGASPIDSRLPHQLEGARHSIQHRILSLNALTCTSIIIEQGLQSMADGVESIYIQICQGTPNPDPRRHDAPATPCPDIPPTPSTNYEGRPEANTGETILHIAVGNDKVDQVREILKDRKFEVNAENLRGETALEIAVKEKYRDIERLLMDNSQVSAFVDRLYRDRQAYVDAANAILVGAALIASITYSGSSLLPASPPDPVNTTAVKAFWAFNSLSFYSAVATVLAGAYGAMPIFHHVFIGQVVKRVKKKLVLATYLLMFSVLCVLGAFTSCAFARLPPNLGKQYKILTTAPFGVALCIGILLVFSAELIWGMPTFSYLFVPLQLLRYLIVHFPQLIWRFLFFSISKLWESYLVMFHYCNSSKDEHVQERSTSMDALP